MDHPTTFTLKEGTSNTMDTEFEEAIAVLVDQGLLTDDSCWIEVTTS